MYRPLKDIGSQLLVPLSPPPFSYKKLLHRSRGVVFVVHRSIVVHQSRGGPSHGKCACGSAQQSACKRPSRPPKTGWFETLDVTQSLSAEENADVRFVLGRMNYEGVGGPKDHVEAARLLGLAAKQGHAKAQESLGLMLREGEGGPQDFTEARRLLGLAAAQGQTEAQAQLGIMLWTGEGGLEDYAEARRLLSLAAEQGEQGSQDLTSRSTQ